MSVAHPLFDLTDRIALVTGSSQGIGLALARGLAQAGAMVVLNGRDTGKLDVAAALLKGEGLKATVAAFDVTDRAAVVAGVERVEKTVGPIDILVNNAGIQRRGSFEDFSAQTWNEIFDTNVHAVFHVAQAVGISMVARKRGKIINICSLTSEMGRASIVPYTATKGAVKMLTKGMCAEWAKHNVQVNGIGPGYFKTELNLELSSDEKFNAWLTARTPAGRWGETPELAGACVFLASDAASFVNGHILYVDGGITAVV